MKRLLSIVTCDINQLNEVDVIINKSGNKQDFQAKTKGLENNVISNNFNSGQNKHADMSEKTCTYNATRNFLLIWADLQRKGDKKTNIDASRPEQIFTLEACFDLEALVVCIQESFLRNYSLAYAGLNLYWPSEMDNRKNIQVVIAIRKYILNKVIIENWTNLVSHPYYIVLDIKKRSPGSKKYSRRNRIVNRYDNMISNGYVWQGSISQHDQLFKIFLRDKSFKAEYYF